MNLLLDRTHTSLDNLKPLNTMFVIDVVFWNRMFRWELKPHIITQFRQRSATLK